MKAMPQIHFVTHYTIHTKSDHDALIVVWRVTMPSGASWIIRVGSWNAGNGTLADLAKVLAACDILGGQEWSDKGKFKRWARRHGWRVSRALRPGAKATPVLSRREIKPLRTISFVLLLTRYIGPGAGPSRNKQKNAEGGAFRWHGVGFTMASFHAPPTQGKNLREKAALDVADNFVHGYAGRRLAHFAVADLNNVLFSTVEAELYKDGWTNNQRIGGKLATHGRRGIDYCFVPLVQFAGKDETTDNEEQR